jgi:hypothetical protein
MFCTKHFALNQLSAKHFHNISTLYINKKSVTIIININIFILRILMAWCNIISYNVVFNTT